MHTVKAWTTDAERERMGQVIQCYRLATLTWCLQAVTAATPKTDLSRTSGTARDPLEGLCCIGRSCGMAERSPAGESDRERQLIERRRKPVMDGRVGGNVIVAASEVLHEGVAGSKDPC